MDHNKEKAFNKAYEKFTKDSINTMLNILKDKKFTFSKNRKVLGIALPNIVKMEKEEKF